MIKQPVVIITDSSDFAKQTIQWSHTYVFDDRNSKNLLKKLRDYFFGPPCKIFVVFITEHSCHKFMIVRHIIQFVHMLTICITPERVPVHGTNLSQIISENVNVNELIQSIFDLASITIVPKEKSFLDRKRAVLPAPSSIATETPQDKHKRILPPEDVQQPCSSKGSLKSFRIPLKKNTEQQQASPSGKKPSGKISLLGYGATIVSIMFLCMPPQMGHAALQPMICPPDSEPTYLELKPQE